MVILFFRGLEAKFLLFHLTTTPCLLSSAIESSRWPHHTLLPPPSKPRPLCSLGLLLTLTLSFLPHLLLHPFLMNFWAPVCVHQFSTPLWYFPVLHCGSPSYSNIMPALSALFAMNPQSQPWLPLLSSLLSAIPSSFWFSNLLGTPSLHGPIKKQVALRLG